MEKTPHSTMISHEVVRAVSEAEGTNPLELQPLEDVIDTDALETIFSSSADAKKTLLLEYEGYTVKDTHRGIVTLEGPSEDVNIH